MTLMLDESDSVGVQAWRWRVEQPGPPLTVALLAGEALRNAVFAAGRRAGVKRLPDTIHGGGANGRIPDPAHTHAFWLSEDDDGDGLIDHMLLFVERGIPSHVVALLADTRSICLGSHEWALFPDWMGRRGPGGLFGPSQIWQAVTPYVTPWWRLTKTGKSRPNFTLDRQVLRELEARGLTRPSEFCCQASSWCGEHLVIASSFATARSNAAPPTDAAAAFPRLVLSEAAWGPLAFGFGAHFGLGLLVPA